MTQWFIPVQPSGEYIRCYPRITLWYTKNLQWKITIFKFGKSTQCAIFNSKLSQITRGVITTARQLGSSCSYLIHVEFLFLMVKSCSIPIFVSNLDRNMFQTTSPCNPTLPSCAVWNSPWALTPALATRGSWSTSHLLNNEEWLDHWHRILVLESQSWHKKRCFHKYLKSWGQRTSFQPQTNRP